jgi:hypothetical protein
MEESKVKTADELEAVKLFPQWEVDVIQFENRFVFLKGCEFKQSHITKLEAKISEQESYIMDSGANYLKSTDELFDRIKELEARNKELEEALQKIVDFDYVPHKMAYDVMGEVEQIAEQALNKK